MKGLIGRKLGMTQVFNERGETVPVTVIEAGPCYVVQVRTAEKDGYEAIQLGFEPAKKATRLSKGERGHLGLLKVDDEAQDAQGAGRGSSGGEALARTAREAG